MSGIDDFIDSQKIIYELKPSRERRVPTPPNGCKEGKQLNDNEYVKIGEIPFVKLLGGKEPLRNVKIRHELYKKNWDRQMHAINAVLSKTDRFKFRSLRGFLSVKNDEQFDDRLTTALLNLGSNISNHDRLLNNVCRYLREDEDICLVRINPNVCFNIQRIIKRIEDTVACKVHDIVSGNSNNRRGMRNNRNKRRKRQIGDDGNGGRKRRRILEANGDTIIKIEDEEDEDYEKLLDDDRVTESDSDDEIGLNNDFDLLPRKIEKDKYVDLEDLLQVLKKADIRMVVLIQNADGMSSNLIEQTLMVLHRYSLISKVYAMIGISTPFIIFQEKVSKLMIGKLKTKTFAIDNSNEAINQIMEDLLLNINETYNSLIFDPQLVLKFLHKRDVMSIQQFNNYMKLIYMRHYFNQPLSVFWTNDFSKIDLNSIYFKIFKILPSVIENSSEMDKKYLTGIIDNDFKVIGELLRINLNKLINWRFNFRNLIDFLNFAQASILYDKIWFNNLELFQMLFEKYYELRDSEEVWNSRKSDDRIDASMLTNFMNEIWKTMLHKPIDEMESFFEQLCNDEQFNFITKHAKFPSNTIKTKTDVKILIESIQNSLRDQVIELDLDNQAFREICVVRDDVVLNIHDAFEPCLRENCLKNLDEPGKVLFNSRHWVEASNEDVEAKEDELVKIDKKMYYIIEPILCEMYRIFKETGVVINVYDFYQVFKNSIMSKVELIKLMKLKLRDSKFTEIYKSKEIDTLNKILDTVSDELESGKETEWDKLTLSWFLKSVSEFQILGLLKEGTTKSQSVEKVIWRGI